MAVSGLSVKTLPAVTVTVAGTAKPLSATPLMVYDVTVQSLKTNTGTQYIGDSTVTSSNGMPFEPGENATVIPPQARGGDQFDLSQVYVNATVNNTEFRVIAWIRA